MGFFCFLGSLSINRRQTLGEQQQKPAAARAVGTSFLALTFINVARNTRRDWNKSSCFLKGPQGCFRLSSHQELASSVSMQEWERGARWCATQNEPQSLPLLHRRPHWHMERGWGEALRGRMLTLLRYSSQFSYWRIRFLIFLFCF